MLSPVDAAEAATLAASSRRVDIGGRQFSLAGLSTLVLGVMIAGVLAYILIVRPAHDGAPTARLASTASTAPIASS